MTGQRPPSKILDFAAGAARRGAGIQASQAHAEADAPGWADRAYGYLCAFASERASAWTCEEFRAWAGRRGLDEPSDGRAFGGVTQRALRAGVIVKVGYAPAASSNGSIKPLYAQPVRESAA